MVIPFLIIVGEFFYGNKEHSLIHQMLTHQHEEHTNNPGKPVRIG